MTPTDDLRARLHSANTLFERMLRECARPVAGSPEGVPWLAAEAYREVAIAALSALPAGGGKCSGYCCPACGRCYECHKQALECLTNPPPNAAPVSSIYRDQRVAEKVGAVADILRKKPDAAVGAQGEEWPGFSQFHLDNWTDEDFRNHIPAVRQALQYAIRQRRLAAPAAGKGVDASAADLMQEASEVLEAVGCSGVTLPDNWRWPLADELSGQAALTRQPVAGDGMVPVPKELTREMFSAGFRQQYGMSEPDPPGGYFDIFNDWYKAMIAAAPTDTPADGGEECTRNCDCVGACKLDRSRP